VEEPTLVSKEDSVVEWEYRIFPPVRLAVTSASPMSMRNRLLSFLCRMRSAAVASKTVKRSNVGKVVGICLHCRAKRTTSSLPRKIDEKD